MTRNGVRAVAPSLPDKLSDRDYWSLVAEFSEPDGEFRSDNLLSNEIFLQAVIPASHSRREAEPRLSWRRSRTELHLHRGPQAEDGLHRRRPARQPAAAPDVQGALRVVIGPRRLHLPAVLAQASGRAGRESTADEIFFAAIYKAAPEKGEADDLLQAESQDTPGPPHRTRHLPLTAEDLKGIEYVYTQFSWFGPGLSYWSTAVGLAVATRRPTGTSWWLTTGRGRTEASWPAKRTSWC